MTIRTFVFASVLCSLMGLLAPPLWAQTPATAQSADFVVALVNSEPITNGEIRAEVARSLDRLRAQKQPVPATEALRAAALERLINDRAQLYHARDTGITVPDFALDQAEENVAQQYQLTVAQLRQRMLKEGMDPARFREQLGDQQTLIRLYERDVDPRARVSEADIDRRLAELAANNTDPLVRNINLAQILIAVPEKTPADQIPVFQQQAEKALARLRAGEDFVRVMQEVSMADKDKGGEVGLRRADRYPAVFVRATQDLQVGEVSEVVRSGAGFHILKVLEKRNPATLIRTMVQTRVRHILLQTTAQQNQARSTAQLADLRRRILAGSISFASAARQYSQDGSAEHGGELGWVEQGAFVPEFEEAMSQLAEGDISAPTASRFGVHLIQVLERRRVDMSPQELRNFVRAQLRESRYEKAFETWAQDIRSRAFVEMREPPQ